MDVTLCAGGVRICSSVECMLPVYSLGGSLVRTISVQVGTQDVSLPQGQYVLNGKVVVIK